MRKLWLDFFLLPLGGGPPPCLLARQKILRRPEKSEGGLCGGPSRTLSKWLDLGEGPANPGRQGKSHQGSQVRSKIILVPRGRVEVTAEPLGLQEAWPTAPTWTAPTDPEETELSRDLPGQTASRLLCPRPLPHAQWLDLTYAP